MGAGEWRRAVRPSGPHLCLLDGNGKKPSWVSHPTTTPDLVSVYSGIEVFLHPRPHPDRGTVGTPHLDVHPVRSSSHKVRVTFF